MYYIYPDVDISYSYFTLFITNGPGIPRGVWGNLLFVGRVLYRINDGMVC